MGITFSDTAITPQKKERTRRITGAPFSRPIVKVTMLPFSISAGPTLHYRCYFCAASHPQFERVHSHPKIALHPAQALEVKSGERLYGQCFSYSQTRAQR